MAYFVMQGLIAISLVLIVVSAAVIITRRNIIGLFSAYALQSFFLAAIVFLLYLQDHHIMFLYTALITIASKTLFIPWLLRKAHQRMHITRDVEFRYLQPGGSLLLSIVVIILMYVLFSDVLQSLQLEKLAIQGIVLGISLTLIGLLIMCTRKQIISKIIAYLVMENGMVLASIFLGEMPLLIEVLVLMDLIIVVLISGMFAFGMNSTIEQFHRRLNLLRELLGRNKE